MPYEQIARVIANSRQAIASTGAGISVESGIPPFRGDGGIWNKYDPAILDLDVFLRSPERSWNAIKEMFTGFLGTSDRTPIAPNPAHHILAKWETENRLRTVITQNIDGLHAAAGTQNLIEFHGHCRTLTCLECGTTLPLNTQTTADAVPRCSCGGLLKPDFVFFGEGIPPQALTDAEQAALATDCMILIGTSGVVQPAASLPYLAKQHGAAIIEINPVPTPYTPGLFVMTLILVDLSGSMRRRDLRRPVR